jgi:hypothetical protein
MKPPSSAVVPLLDVVEDALSLLGDYQASADDLRPVREPLPSLLAQCDVFGAAARAAQPEPLRTIHHLACTGGTLISKCLALMPNAVALSEIDPLSRLGLSERVRRFAPTDIILGMRASLRAGDDALAAEVALAALASLRDRLQTRGQTLVLRDHPHSQFFTADAFDSRPTLRALLAPALALRSVVTVRHPVDSLLALRHNGWVHYRPDTVDEYCRRALAFLDAHAGLPILRYEDFVADPEAILTQLCRHLDLPYRAGTPDLIAVVRMSGDSGRGGDEIVPRPRRAMPPGLPAELRDSLPFGQLCARLGYDPAG